MEPPKKRKYPEHLDIVPLVSSGSCAVMGVAMEAEQTGGLIRGTNIDTQQPVVTSQGGPAKRNRRSYSLEFKVAVLDSYYSDAQTKLNQRKTALKYGVNRRQIQKWLAQEETLRGSVGAGYTQNHSLGQVPPGLTGLCPLTSVSSNGPPLTSVTSSSGRVTPVKTSLTQPRLMESPEEIAEEPQFVIDEAKPLTDYSSDFHEDEAEEEEKPINLCKVDTSQQLSARVKLEASQVDPSRDPGQFAEVGSSVSSSGSKSVSRSHPDPVSSHILDTSLGLPASGVMVTMYRMGGEQVWTKLMARVTNSDGRASNFLGWEDFKPGTYKMHFATGQYYKEKQTETFYPYAEVVFEIKDPEAHYHVPLLLNPFGYSTYRGS